MSITRVWNGNSHVRVFILPPDILEKTVPGLQMGAMKKERRSQPLTARGKDDEERCTGVRSATPWREPGKQVCSHLHGCGHGTLVPRREEGFYPQLAGEGNPSSPSADSKKRRKGIRMYQGGWVLI